MPFFASTTDPAQAMGSLASALFPDPSKLAQAQYYGAESRRAGAQTEQLGIQNDAARSQLAAKSGLAQIFVQAAQNPTTENMSRAWTTALQAGYTPKDVAAGVLAANRLAPGHLPQSLLDSASTLASGGNFGNTETGTQQGFANARTVAGIQTAPSMMNAQTTRQVATETPHTYIDPRTGQSTSIRLGQMPTDGMVPVENGPNVTSSIIAANAPRTSVVPGPGPFGITTQTQPSIEPAPANSLPYTPAAPAQSAVGAGLTMPNGQPPAASGQPPAPPGQPPAAPGLPDLMAGQPSGPTAPLRGAAENALATTSKVQPGKDMTPKEVEAQIAAGEQAISASRAETNSGVLRAEPYIFDEQTRGQIKARAAQLERDPSRRGSTYQNPQAALAQAIQEASQGASYERNHGIVPWSPHNSLIHGSQAFMTGASAAAPGGGSSFPRMLPPAQAETLPAPTPQTPAASPVPVPAPASAGPAPAPAPNPNGPTVVQGQGDTAVRWDQAAMNSGALPRAPADPSLWTRLPPGVYATPSGRPARWTGQHWVAP